MARFVKKPVEIEAVQFTGDNVVEVQLLTGMFAFSEVDPEDRGDDPDIIASVFDKLHSTWVGVKRGQWIIKGVKGEFYPCDENVFIETYDPISA